MGGGAEESAFCDAASAAKRAISVVRLLSASREASSVRMSSWASTKGGELGKEWQQHLEDTELVVETVDELMHQCLIWDRGITIGEWIGELVEPMTEVISKHLALNEIVKFVL
jgi:hypothetical protein